MENAKWQLDTLFILEDIFGKKSNIVESFKNINYVFNGTLEYDVGDYQYSRNIADLNAYRRG